MVEVLVGWWVVAEGPVVCQSRVVAGAVGVAHGQVRGVVDCGGRVCLGR